MKLLRAVGLTDDDKIAARLSTTGGKSSKREWRENFRIWESFSTNLNTAIGSVFTPTLRTPNYSISPLTMWKHTTKVLSFKSGFTMTGVLLPRISRCETKAKSVSVKYW